MDNSRKKPGYYGCSSKREVDENAYRLGLRDGIFGYWMTRPSQINETRATRKNYFRGFIDGVKHSNEDDIEGASKDDAVLLRSRMQVAG